MAPIKADSVRKSETVKRLRFVIEATLCDKSLPQPLRGSAAVLSEAVFEQLRTMPDDASGQAAMIVFIDYFLERLDPTDLPQKT